MHWQSWEGNPRLYAKANRRPQLLLTPEAASPINEPQRCPAVDTGSVLKFSVEMTPVRCDAGGGGGGGGGAGPGPCIRYPPAPPPPPPGV